MKEYILLMLVVLIIGCSNSNEPSKVAQNLEKFKIATVENPDIPAPKFTLTDDKNQVLDNENLKGKVYVLQGYTFGCSSCAHEVAVLNQLYSKYQDKIEIISMDVVSEDMETALETKKVYNGGDWHWALDSDNVAAKFKMQSLEATYIVDKEGIIRYKDESSSDPEVLSKEIEKLI